VALRAGLVAWGDAKKQPDFNFPFSNIVATGPLCICIVSPVALLPYMKVALMAESQIAAGGSAQ